MSGSEVSHTVWAVRKRTKTRGRRTHVVLPPAKAAKATTSTQISSHMADPAHGYMAFRCEGREGPRRRSGKALKALKGRLRTDLLYLDQFPCLTFRVGDGVTWGATAPHEPVFTAWTSAAQCAAISAREGMAGGSSPRDLATALKVALAWGGPTPPDDPCAVIVEVELERDGGDGGGTNDDDGLACFPYLRQFCVTGRRMRLKTVLGCGSLPVLSMPKANTKTKTKTKPKPLSVMCGSPLDYMVFGTRPGTNGRCQLASPTDGRPAVRCRGPAGYVLDRFPLVVMAATDQLVTGPGPGVRRIDLVHAVWTCMGCDVVEVTEWRVGGALGRSDWSRPSRVLTGYVYSAPRDGSLVQVLKQEEWWQDGKRVRVRPEATPLPAFTLQCVLPSGLTSREIEVFGRGFDMWRVWSREVAASPWPYWFPGLLPGMDGVYWEVWDADGGCMQTSYVPDDDDLLADIADMRPTAAGKDGDGVCGCIGSDGDDLNPRTLLETDASRSCSSAAVADVDATVSADNVDIDTRALTCMFWGVVFYILVFCGLGLGALGLSAWATWFLLLRGSLSVS